MKAITFLIVFLMSLYVCAQAPEHINYQSVARNSSGNLLVNQAVSFRLSILQGSTSGVVVYSESHTSVTNDFGISILKVGGGTVLSGVFAMIDWGSGPYFLQTEMDPTGGTTFQMMGTSEFLYVPYALYARTAENVSNPPSSIQDSDQDTKIQTEATPDDDNIRFDIGGIERWIMKGTRLEPVNTGTSVFIGTDAGSSEDPAFYSGNIGIGYSALGTNYSGFGNVAMGSWSLSSNQSSNNTALGYFSMQNNSTGYSNTAMGSNSLQNNLSGYQNTALGEGTLSCNRNGFGNTVVGYSAAGYNSGLYNPSNNTIVGTQAGYTLTSGNSNILLGFQAGDNITTGSNNIIIGYDIDGLSNVATNKLIIGASDLIFGDIIGKKIGIGTTAPLQKLSVGDGNIALTNTGTAREMMFYEPGGSGTNYSSFKAQAQSANIIYSLPAADGSNGAVLSTNGSGILSWKTSFINTLQDADNDTKVQVEKNADEDIIRFDLGGTERWVMTGSRLEPSNSDNTFIGFQAGYSTSLGARNTVCGYEAFRANNINNRCTVVGYQAMHNAESNAINPKDASNTAVGYRALYGGTTPISNTGVENTAMGSQAMLGNTTGSYCTAVGTEALSNNTTGSLNTAIGSRALLNNESGSENIAIGYGALFANTSGSFNTAVGQCLINMTSGERNVVIGENALYALYTGSRNTIVGTSITFSGDYTGSTGIGWNSEITANNQVRLGGWGIGSIGGYADWTNISDGRYKKDIQYNVPGLDFINKLNPVTYKLDTEKLRERSNRYRRDDEKIPAGMIQRNEIRTGFIAQEVEQAARELGYDFSGVDAPKNDTDTYGLRYAQFVVPLVKAVQELSAQNEALIKENEDIRKRLEVLEQKRIH